jgi:hypothetical protein
MQFMLVLYEDPELIATEEQRQEAVQRVGEYAMSLVGDGMLKGGSPLHRVTEAKQVRTRNGQQRILDGPFAEAKEVIAGFFVVEASSVEAVHRDRRALPERRVRFGRGPRNRARGMTRFLLAGTWPSQLPGLLAAAVRPARTPLTSPPSLPATQKGGRPGAVGAGAATTRKRARTRPCRYSSCRR